MADRKTPSGEVIPEFAKNAPDHIYVRLILEDNALVFEGRAELRRLSGGTWGYTVAGRCDLPGSMDRQLQVSSVMFVIGSEPVSDKGSS